MANIKSAKKRARQSEQRRLRNVSARSMVRSALRKVVKAIEAKDKAAAVGRFHRRSAGDGSLRRSRPDPQEQSCPS